MTASTVSGYTRTSSQLYIVQNFENERKAASIWGICQLPSGNIVVADYNNKKVKMLDGAYKESKQIAPYCLPSSPKSVCFVKGTVETTGVAATVDKSIYFLSIINYKFELTRTVKLDHYCGCICYHDGHLYVGSETAIYKYTIAGKLVKKLYEDIDKSVGPQTVVQFALSEDGKKIYVTTWNRNSIITLNAEGKKVAKFQDPELGKATGVCVANNGHVIVCGYSKPCSMIELDKNGEKKIGVIADCDHDIFQVWSLWFNRKTSEIISGQDTNMCVLGVK